MVSDHRISRIYKGPLYHKPNPDLQLQLLRFSYIIIHIPRFIVLVKYVKNRFRMRRIQCSREIRAITWSFQSIGQKIELRPCKILSGIRLKFVRNTRADQMNAVHCEFVEFLKLFIVNYILWKIVPTPQWRPKYANSRQQIRLRMRTFAWHATYLTALGASVPNSFTLVLNTPNESSGGLHWQKHSSLFGESVWCSNCGVAVEADFSALV